MRSLMIAVSTLFLAGPVSAQDFCEEPLRLGYENWPPFQIATDGKPEGIDMDIHNVIAKKIGCEIKWVEIPWKRLMRKIENGQIDGASAANINDERKKFANFTESYLPYEAILWVKNNEAGKYDSLDEFLEDGSSITTARGYDYGEKASDILSQENFKDQIEITNSPEISIRMLAAGRTDGTIGNRYVLGYLAQENKVRDNISATNVVVQSSLIHFMFSKDSVPEELVNAYNEEIRKLKEDGSINKIVNKYTGN